MKKLNGRKKRRILQAVAILAAATMAFSYAELEWNPKPVVFADTAEEIRDDAKDKKEELEDEVKDLEDEQKKNAQEIKDAAEEMRVLLGEQEKLSANIKDTQKKVDKAGEDLKIAKNKEEEEYEAMKLRIQYMYENSGDDSFFTVLLSSNGISDMLTRFEYINEVHNADRRLMASYKKVVEDVEELQAGLEKEMQVLCDLQEEFDAKQGKLEKLIVVLEQKSDEYKEQLADAKEQIEEQEKIIEEQERIIREQEAEAADEDADDYEGGGSGDEGFGDDSYLTDPSCDPEFVTDVSGTELCNFARQFVGNPYKWGGNSLTNGCDCSGFVNLVYKHFGFAVPRYSQAFKTVGRPVGIDNIKPGDIVVYPGHVAIYYGNGKIVEAQSTRRGITDNRSVRCHTITAIRRVL